MTNANYPEKTNIIYRLRNEIGLMDHIVDGAKLVTLGGLVGFTLLKVYFDLGCALYMRKSLEH
jgi:hypothetical protein